ncbi:MAG: hypothetical protein ACRDRQ_17605 [Pseudonocardiaceae bacterium]
MSRPPRWGVSSLDYHTHGLCHLLVVMVIDVGVDQLGELLPGQAVAWVGG